MSIICKSGVKLAKPTINNGNGKFFIRKWLPNTHIGVFSDLVRKFFLVGNPSPSENAILRGKIKLSMSNQYKLNKQNLKLQERSTLEFNLLFYNSLCIEFLV
jgi:hypothetical protein